jgi:hypothetical protein
MCFGSQNWRARRLQILREDRLPHDEHPHLPVDVPRQHLLSRGRPPLTSGSSRRQQQNQARNVGLDIERFLELAEICLGKRENRLLAAWCRSRTPEVRGTKQNNSSDGNADEPFRFHGARTLAAHKWHFVQLRVGEQRTRSDHQ